MNNFTIEDLKKAFEGGLYAAKSNTDRELLLNSGTKSCPAIETFESWFEVNYQENQTKQPISNSFEQQYNRWPGEPMGNIG